MNGLLLAPMLVRSMDIIEELKKQEELERYKFQLLTVENTLKQVELIRNNEVKERNKHIPALLRKDFP